jgi:hypothetical protein
MTRRIERELRREFPFAEISVSGSSHYRLRLPNGKLVTTSSTPSCPYWLDNVKRDVKRASETNTCSCDTSNKNTEA